MTGPEHYREAERLLAVVADQMVVVGQAMTTGKPSDAIVMAAQTAQVTASVALVEATLAAAAAAALPAASAYYGDESTAVRHWAQVIEA